MRPTAVLSARGQRPDGPSGEADQSYVRISAPISPPPARKPGDEGTSGSAFIIRQPDRPAEWLRCAGSAAPAVAPIPEEAAGLPGRLRWHSGTGRRRPEHG